MESVRRRFLRYNSQGYQKDPPALFHPNILVGAGEMLTPEFVKKYGITHVINCAEDSDSPTWWRNTNPDKYYHIHAQDSLHANILKWYPEFKAILKLYLQDPSSMTVFVHCQCGINRSAFLSLMYVCDVFKFPLKSTEISLLKQRPCMLTNTSFRKQVFEALNNGKS
jgi:protein-tyrosine phosphatase